MAEPEHSRNTTPPNFLSVGDAAPHIPCKPASLATPSFRRRLGVPFYRIGGRIMFDPEQIAAWREQRRVEPMVERAAAG
jgi:hypothetical protein